MSFTTTTSISASATTKPHTHHRDQALATDNAIPSLTLEMPVPQDTTVETDLVVGGKNGNGGDGGGGDHNAHTAIIASFILGLGFFIMLGVICWLIMRRRRRTRDLQDREKSGMLPLHSMESLSIGGAPTLAPTREEEQREVEGLGLRGGGGEGSVISSSITSPRSELSGVEAPPPKYEEAVPLSHQKIAGGAVMRRGAGQHGGEDDIEDEEADGMVADGRQPMSERIAEEASGNVADGRKPKTLNERIPEEDEEAEEAAIVDGNMRPMGNAEFL